MGQTPTHRHVHEAPVRASAEDVHRLLADEDNWPRVFASFVHLENLGPEGGSEGGSDRIGMWGHYDGTIEHWVALRRIDQDALRVEFQPESLPPALESMRRSWVVEPTADGGSTVRLEHEYRLKDPAAAEGVRAQVEEIAASEVAAAREAAELASLQPEALVTVEDEVTVAAPVAAVFSALYEAAEWPSYMEHVARADVFGGGEGHTHVLEVDTIERHGGIFTTRAARVGLPGAKIAYKQLLLPPLGASHHVQWLLSARDGATVVRSVQTVVIKESGVAAVLGEGTGVAAARPFVQNELSSKVRLIFDAVKHRLEQDAN
ncbi:SRPBCC family protein [Streptomyces racemochromogenes]|uniref:SRPBCC family protein n=1 Tax=Streptomyces racemochromogenes TaxID=67353 RepID=UPI0035ED5D6F